MTRTTPLLLLLIALSSTGCAEIVYESKELRRTVIHTDRTLKPVAIRADVRQEGSLVEGEAARLCDAFEVKEVQRRVHEEPRNKLLAADIVGLSFGAGFAALGVGLIVDAGHVYPNNLNSRLYNRNGPGAATAGGVASLVIGAAIMAGPAVGLVKTAAAPSKDTVDVIKENGPTTERRIPCDLAMTAANERVSARVGSTSFDLGATDKRGGFSVDIGEKIPAERLHVLGDPTRMQLWVGSSQVGEIAISPPKVAAALPVATAPVESAPAPPPPAVAVSPEDAKSRAAVKSAKDACARACAAACSGKAACADACAREACK